jgi:hypothetical protein
VTDGPLTLKGRSNHHPKQSQRRATNGGYFVRQCPRLFARQSGSIEAASFEMNTRRSRNSASEWLLLFGLMAIAILLTELLGLSRRWSDAITYTVVVFTVVIQMLRPAWDRLFWRSLFLIFLLHVIGILILVESMPRSWRGIPGLFMTIVGATEGIVIVAVLWKKARRPDRDGDAMHQ